MPSKRTVRRARPRKISMTDQFLRCRQMRQHTWEDVDNVLDPPTFGAPLDYRCVHCGTIKRQIYSRFTGERLAPPRYVYPDGYQMKAEEIPSRNELTVELIRRQGKRAA